MKTDIAMINKSNSLLLQKERNQIMDETLKQIIEEICQRPMRSSIITAAALMDSMLEKVLDNYLVRDANREDIFSFQGCLCTFSAKINMAYALGLISKDLCDDMHLFRKMRNDCAHEFILDEKITSKIRSMSGNFKLLKKVFKFGGSEDTLTYTGLEFSIIFVCLLKRMKNTTTLDAYPCEAHDDYLGFQEEDYEFIQNFSSKMK